MPTINKRTIEATSVQKFQTGFFLIERFELNVMLLVLDQCIIPCSVRCWVQIRKSQQKRSAFTH